MTILPEPTDRQQEILDEHRDLLVIGPPGCGKTTVALAKAVTFIGQTRLTESQSVLFLSFSNAAVHRIREAARGTIRRPILRRIQITTFHGLCFRVLMAHRRLIGLGRPFQLLPPEDATVLESRLANDGVATELIRLEREEGRVSFDRFAPLVIQLFERVPVISAAYAGAFPFVIVDEYQDTSDEQDALVQMLACGGQVMFLGDPDQRIYDYVPGTRPDRLTRTAERDGVRVLRLETNHRSGANDVAAVARAVLQGIVEIPKPASVHRYGFGDRPSQIRLLKRTIVQLERYLDNNSPPGASRSVAIMARTNAYVQGLSSALLETDDEWRYPFRHQVLLNPDAVAVAWDAVMVLLEPDLSSERRTAEVLRSAARVNRLKVGVQSRLDQAERLERWAEDVEAGHLSGRAQAANELRTRIQAYVPTISGDPISDCRAAREVLRGLPGNNLDQLTAVLDLRMPTGGLGDLSGALGERYLDRGGYEGAREISEAALLQERMELGSYSRSPRVLMTMHKCKGKQFSGVIIVEGHRRPNRLLMGSEQESRRLLHVAMTRAELKTIILTPRYDPSPLLPRFLDE